MKTAKLKRTPRKVSPTASHDASFLADQIEAVATLMWAVSEAMEYYAGFNYKLIADALAMARASIAAQAWAMAVRRGGKKEVQP